MWLRNCHSSHSIKSFLFWKYHSNWCDLKGMPRIIKKMTDIWKFVLGPRKWQRCVDGGSWVSLKLLRWLRNDNLFYFGRFTECDVMSEVGLELSKRISDIWKSFLASTKCQSCVHGVSWVYWKLLTWLRNYRVFILEVSLSLTLFRRNTPNYQKNDEYLEDCFRL